jgi:hypothetical protein
VIFENIITIDELLKTEVEISEHPEYRNHFKGVFDFRNSKKNIIPEDLNKLKPLTIESNPIKGNWCSINSTPLESALSALFKSERDKIHRFELFSSVKAASEYLYTDVSNYLN